MANTPTSSQPPIGIPFVQLTADDMQDPSLQKFNEQQRQVYLAIQQLSARTSGLAPSTPSQVVPKGLINGTNKTFTLPANPPPSLLRGLFLNGILQQAGTQANPADYILNEVTITMTVAPPVKTTLIALY